MKCCDQHCLIIWIFYYLTPIQWLWCTTGHNKLCTYFIYSTTIDHTINHECESYWLWSGYKLLHFLWNSGIFMPPPLGAGGIMFSGCPSVRPSVRRSVRLSIRPSVRPKPEIASFDLYMCPLVHPTNRNRFTACPSVRPSVCPSVRLSVRPSGEVSGHLPEKVWREWPEILHADVSWPSSELISLWPRSVDF